MNFNNCQPCEVSDVISGVVVDPTGGGTGALPNPNPPTREAHSWTVDIIQVDIIQWDGRHLIYPSPQCFTKIADPAHYRPILHRSATIQNATDRQTVDRAIERAAYAIASAAPKPHSVSVKRFAPIFMRSAIAFALIMLSSMSTAVTQRFYLLSRKLLELYDYTSKFQSYP